MRQVPYCIATEKSVLGSMLISEEALYAGIEKLDTNSFHSTVNREIFRAITSIVQNNRPVDIITLRAELTAHDMLNRVGGDNYITSLTNYVSTSRNILSHIDILQNKSALRRILSLSDNLSQQCVKSDADYNKIIEVAEEQIYDIAEGNMRGDPETAGELIHGTFKDINASVQGDTERGIKSGFKNLDFYIPGFRAGEYITLAARPGRGKTAFALSMLLNVSVRNKVPSLIFSLEMSKTQLMQRMLCGLSRVSMSRLRAGYLNKRELALLVESGDPLSEAPITIDDTTQLNPVEIAAKSRQVQRKHGLGLVVVDYLQLMNGYGKHESRQLEIASISRALKGMAKDLDVPVIGLSQLSRDIEKRGNNARPKLSDLRESGAIEQDSDVVLFVHRPDQSGEEDGVGGNVAEIIIGKQREGPVGSTRLSFTQDYALFEDLDERNDTEF